MEAEEEEFDLNEGLTAMIIIEAYERTYPEPQAFEDDYVTFTEEWIAWRERLVEYADGWKACIAWQQWYTQWQKDNDDIHYILSWFNDGAKTILWWRLENAIEGTESLRQSEGIWAILWCEMLPVDIGEDDWNYRPKEDII